MRAIPAFEEGGTVVMILESLTIRTLFSVFGGRLKLRMTVLEAPAVVILLLPFKLMIPAEETAVPVSVIKVRFDVPPPPGLPRNPEFDNYNLYDDDKKYDQAVAPLVFT